MIFSKRPPFEKHSFAPGSLPFLAAVLCCGWFLATPAAAQDNTATITGQTIDP
jgi:hypothetical protein